MFVFSNEGFTLQLDFWTSPSKSGKPVDIHVPHNRMRQFKHALKRKSISFRIKIRNLQRVINKAGMVPRAVPFNGKFHSYSQVSLQGTVTEMYILFQNCSCYMKNSISFPGALLWNTASRYYTDNFKQ